ncbi:hypothetical protein L1049_019899 [Liquidambar formosana]|uniref:SHSP domain-containing protein n=1 Tax=Liquidambar formosana TaxID=63359 RepID=A0AAP0SC09_LIQFO
MGERGRERRKKGKRGIKGISRETASFEHANIDWKETPTAHVFKADVPGLKKGDVKVELEDSRVL